MCKLQMYIPRQDKQAAHVDELLQGWPWARHDTGCRYSFDGDVVIVMLYSCGA